MLKLLLKIFYIKIPDRILKKIIEKKTISSLETILESGHYKNRIFIYENLENIEFDNRKGLLKILINDSIKKLSEGAINALTLFELSEDEKRIIQEKKEYWLLKHEQDESKKITKHKINNKRKFSKGESYSNMKNMLKKPMNTGKWF